MGRTRDADGGDARLRLVQAKPLLLIGLATLIALLATLAGWTRSSESSLRLMRDGLHARTASGAVTIVEIDARSLAGLGRWPWPRDLHARLVDRLVASDAQLIVFDVDFSARSTATSDRAFAEALARAEGRVALPTFRQAQSDRGDAQLENVPIALLREYAMLASVNVRPERNGQLIHYSFGTVTGGVPRPSIAALIAGRAGTTRDSFRIDSAIDPASIPRISAIDVLNGHIPLQHVRGRTILIGGTAIEMGDRYALPRHGIQPGVVAQALAAETLIAGTDADSFGPILPVLATIVILIAVALRRGDAEATMHRVILAGTVLGAPLLLEAMMAMSIDVIPALTIVALEFGATKIAAFANRLRRERLTDTATGLPNARALERALMAADTTVVVVRALRFEAMDATLDEAGRRELSARIIERLKLGFAGIQFHAIGPGTFAWAETGADPAVLVSRIDSAASLFRVPIEIAGRTIPFAPSFGLASNDAGNATAAIAQATLAARQGEVTGRRWSIHSDDATNTAQRELTLLADIDGAIDGGDIFVVYQPKLNVAAGRITGAEALVRWKHPDLGPISPDSFIPLLEDSGNIARLTLAVLRMSLEELARWHAIDPVMSVAVNVSAALLTDHGFVRGVNEQLDSAGPLARHLTLEITESGFSDQSAAAISLLAALRQRGVRISIDDYGTGRATMSYLRTFPIDELKIDKSFVTGMLDQTGDQIFVRSAVELARELDCAVVAEGAESDACVAKLVEYGCHYVQGWAIGKPMPAEDFRTTVLCANMPATLRAA
ncbi:MAG: EAL domain-containing protein [Sphingomonadaceae bacterium]